MVPSAHAAGCEVPGDPAVLGSLPVGMVDLGLCRVRAVLALILSPLVMGHDSRLTILSFIIGGGVSDMKGAPMGRHGHWDKHGDWRNDASEYPYSWFGYSDDQAER